MEGALEQRHREGTLDDKTEQVMEAGSWEAGERVRPWAGP